jgi:pimeloyl-ACP methyl ester carboxylesterase
MTLLRKLGWLLAAAIAVLAMVYGTLRAGWWASDAAALRAKYAAPPSSFITIDGVPIHVRDEGSGPVVVMLHGSIANLHEWDLVAPRLTDRYRVIRLDWPPYGLSGPDPSGIYSTARAAELLHGMIAAMKLPPVVLVATSNGANVALEFNLHHAEMVRAMALSILPLERPSQTRAVDWRLHAAGPLHAAMLPDFHFRWWYRVIIQDTTAPGFEPTPDMIDSLYELDNLPGAAQRQRQYIDSNTRLFKAGDIGTAVARAVIAPVLLQWCDLDTVIAQSLEDTLRRFVHTQVELVRYPDLGHFPMWEAPDRFSADLRRFLDRVSQAAP